MQEIDSYRAPVTLCVDHSGRWDRHAWLVFPAMALGVALTAMFRTVHWWGWLGALLVVVVGVPATRRLVSTTPGPGCRLAGDELQLSWPDRTRLIPAPRIQHLVTTGDDVFPLTLVLDDGERMELPIKPYWERTAVPTARVLAGWVRRHGGGTGGVPLQVPPEPALPKRRIAGFLLGALVLWLGMVLCLSTWFGEHSPRFGSGWGGYVGAVGGGWYTRHRRRTAPVKDWLGNTPGR